MTWYTGVLESLGLGWSVIFLRCEYVVWLVRFPYRDAGRCLVGHDLSCGPGARLGRQGTACLHLEAIVLGLGAGLWEAARKGDTIVFAPPAPRQGRGAVGGQRAGGVFPSCS